MSMMPIEPTITPYIPPTLSGTLRPRQAQMGPQANPLHELLANNPLLRKHPRLARDAKQLLELKKKLRATRHCRQGRGRRARHRRLRQRFAHMAQRFAKNLRGLMQRQQTQTTQAAGTSSELLNDPNMSMNDKVELFVMQLIKESENQLQELMDKHNASKSSSSSSSSSKSGGFFKNLLSKIAPVVGGIVGGPVGAVAGSAVSGAVSGAADSSSSESDERMLMFKMQKIKAKVDQMIQFISQRQKADQDTIGRIIGNMR